MNPSRVKITILDIDTGVELQIAEAIAFMELQPKSKPAWHTYKSINDMDNPSLIEDRVNFEIKGTSVTSVIVRNIKL